MNCDVLIVGGGIAGLTSCAYIGKQGLKGILCEKNSCLGGLVNSFEKEGFTFDAGIRAFENSGILFPMLKQLNIEINTVKNPVSIKIGQDSVQLTSNESIDDYKEFLTKSFPLEEEGISKIITEIKRATDYSKVLYGIDNPLLIDNLREKNYLYNKLIPWFFQYISKSNKIKKMNQPVNAYLKNFTQNNSLIDLITQHFFKDTPTFFALSYFALYLDYIYPLGGTGMLPEKLREVIKENKSEIKTNCEIKKIYSDINVAETNKGEKIYYKKLIWAADSKALYDSIVQESISNFHIKKKFERKKSNLSDKKGNDSILSIYLSLNVEPIKIKDAFGIHCFFTPSKEGLSSINKLEFPNSKNKIKEWLSEFFEKTTYEISCPCLRDSSLSPNGKTGLIVSTLMDYDLVRTILDNGWYEEFKAFSVDEIIKSLESINKIGIEENLISAICSTPITIERLTGNLEGAITGWSFSNKRIPAESRFGKIKKSVNTEIPNIFTAGQWTFSPSGMPISILTGKIAADKAIKELKGRL